MSRQPFVKPLANATVVAPRKTKDAQVFIPKSSKTPFGSSAKSSILGKRQKPLSTNLFDEDDEDDRILLPPKKPLLKLLDEGEEINTKNSQSKLSNLKDQKEENEEDPLDVFMTGIKKAPIQSENKGTRGDIEDEDDMDSFVIHRENELRNHPELLALDEMEDYDSGAEDFLDTVRADHLVCK